MDLEGAYLTQATLRQFLSDRRHSTDPGQSLKAVCLGGSTFKVTLYSGLSLIIRAPLSSKHLSPSEAPKTEEFIVFLEVGYLCEGCTTMAPKLCPQTSHGCADPLALGTSSCFSYH